MSTGGLYSVSQIAHRLGGTSRQNVYGLRASGTLRSFAKADVEAYLTWRRLGHIGTPPGCPGDLCVRDFARRVHLPESTVRYRIQAGLIPTAHRHGRNVFITVEVPANGLC